MLNIKIVQTVSMLLLEYLKLYNFLENLFQFLGINVFL
jgi:hypothetical protein